MLFSDLEDYGGIVLIFECLTTGHDHAPSFSDNPRTGRYSNSASDDVGSSVEEDDLLACVLGDPTKYRSALCHIQNAYLREDFLDSFCIIRDTITFCPMSADTDELVNGVIRILRMTFAENLAGLVKQTRRFMKSRNVALSVSSDSASTRIDIALSPRFDCLGTALQDYATVKHADGHWDVDELDIVKYE